VPVSVLYVNYRVYEDLDRSLGTLRPYLGPEDEVIVVDNAADPDRFAWLAGRHPDVRMLMSGENLGFAAGVNFGAHHASRPYLMLLNPDTIVEGPVVGMLEAWLRDHPDTGAAGPRVLGSDGRVQASARRFPGISSAFAGRTSWLTMRFPDNWVTRRELPGRTATDPLDVDWVAGSCLMTTRMAFDRVGGFDERFFLYWEDADYCCRLQAAGLKTTYVPGVQVRHAGGHSADQVPALAIRAFHRSAVRLHARHGGRLARVLSPLTSLAMQVRAEWYVWRASRGARAKVSASPRVEQP
jgi:GT2 family glycosyltransferase